MSALRLSAPEKLILLVCYRRYGIVSLGALFCDVDTAYETVGRLHARKNRLVTSTIIRSLKSLFQKRLVDFDFLYDYYGYKEKKRSTALLAELADLIRKPESFQEYYTALLERVRVASSVSPSRKLKEQATASRLFEADRLLETKQAELDRLQRTGIPSRYTKIETVMLTREGEIASRRLNDKFEARSAYIAALLASFNSQPIEKQADLIATSHLLCTDAMLETREVSSVVITRGGNRNGSNVRTGQDAYPEEPAGRKASSAAG